MKKIFYLLLCCQAALYANYAYITNQSTNAVTVIDTVDNSLVATPDGQYVYVVGGNNFITVIRTADNSFVTNFGSSFLPGSIFNIYIASNISRSFTRPATQR